MNILSLLLDLEFLVFCKNGKIIPNSYASLTDRESTASSNIMNPIYSGGHGSRFSSAVDSPRSGPTPNSRYINVNQSPDGGPDRFQFPSVHSNTSGMFCFNSNK